MKIYPAFLSLFLLIIIGCENQSEPDGWAVVPTPHEIVFSKGGVDLSKGFEVKVGEEELNPLLSIISQDYRLLVGKALGKSELVLNLRLDSQLGKEQYMLEVDDNIEVKGGSYAAIVMGLTTIWQSMDEQFQLPKMKVSDQPKFGYRSVMLDVARAWHHPETIKTIVDLCRWYKINYLHLHLTDDSAFSFPSEEYPELATENHSYSKAELIELNQYAYERGVILIPEIDVPGHSSQFIKKMPELFGIEEIRKNPYTVNMGKEEVYTALETILKEVADVFSYSPYIHIGGDEAFFDGMEDDPDIVKYMKENELPNMHELFLHFLIRINESVKNAGKQTMVWAGFGEKGELQIPKDVIVLDWEHTHHDPFDLLEKGYPMVNATFKPLYVVNNRKWEAKYIYSQWRPNRWESWGNKGDFIGIELPANDLLMGASMCAWEQSQVNQLPRLRNRLASMSEHLWNTPSASWDVFYQKQQMVDRRFERFIRPFEVAVDGLMYPDLEEGNFYEHRWFGNSLNVNASSTINGLDLQYAVVRDPGGGDWMTMDSSLTMIESSPLHIRAVDEDGKQVGHEYFQKFYYKPFKVTLEGLDEELPIGSWEKLRFQDTLWVSLSTEHKGGTIRYRIDGRAVSAADPAYEASIPITNTAHFRAQLFDESGEKVGSTFSETYYKIWVEESLTTGKPVTASNDDVVPNCGVPAVNGRISLWEMWGDHVQDENWVMVDFEKMETVRRFKVYTFWDNWRYYQYTIEGSVDGNTWSVLVDNSENKEISTSQGIEHVIDPVDVRFVRINMLYNSANPGLHLVEFGAFSD